MDASDILGIGKSTVLARAASVDELQGKAKKRKMDGLTREVMELKRDNQAQMARAMGYMGDEVATHWAPVVPAFKERPNADRTAVQKWGWLEFSNSGRSDGLKLKHWTKVDAQDPDYPFAKYSRRPEVLSYTEAEYEEHYKSSTWTKEETDLLVDLCERFDLRFIVIADRMKETHPHRTIEDIRERYYEMVRGKLKRAALMDSSVDLLQHHLFKYKYNKEHEIARKQQAERLASRTAAQLQEEEELIKAYKRIEADRKKRAISRKRNQRTSTSARKKGSHKKSSLNASDTTIKIKRSSSGQLVSVPVPVTKVLVIRTPLPAGDERNAYPRTNLMERALVGLSLEQTLAVDAKLDELQVPARPMATAAVVEAYNSLRTDIAKVLQLQQQAQEKELQLQRLRAHAT